MAKFKVGDRVKVVKEPADWPSFTKFKLIGAEGTVGCWVDWPEAMDPYEEYVYVMIEKTPEEAKAYEGVNMIFHDHTLEKI